VKAANWKIFFLFALLVPCWVIAYHGLGDLPMYYAVAGYNAQGELSKIYGDNAGVGHFFYAPLSLVLFGWMPFFSYPVVKVLWTLINTGAYVLFWAGLFRLFPLLQRKEVIWPFLLVWIVSIKPLHAGFQSHNVQIILAAGFVWAEIFSRAETKAKRVISGALVALMGMVKVFPLFIAGYYFLFRSREVRWGVAGGFVLGLLLCALFLGPESTLTLHQTFLNNLALFHNFAPLTQDAVTLSLASLCATWLSPVLGMSTALLINKILSLCLVGGFLFFVWGRRHERSQRYQISLWALALAVMTVVNSSTRPDYFVFFVPAFAALAEMGAAKIWARISPWGVFVSFALIALISEWVLGGNRDLGHKLELLRLPVVGMLVLCATLLHEVSRRKKPI
jgi:hypothetical protein